MSVIRKNPPWSSRAAIIGGLLALLPALPGLSGCGVSVVGHWQMVTTVPNKEVFCIDNASFRRDGTFSALYTFEGKTTLETGTYKFNSFKLILQPQAGGRRSYSAVQRLGKLEIKAGQYKVVLKKGKKMNSTDKSELVRRHIIYTGHVQGVFFRATTADLSRGFSVAGYVRNLPDGTVELVAEGSTQQVDAFLGSIARHFEGHITRVQSTEQPARGGESGFEIRY